VFLGGSIFSLFQHFGKNLGFVQYFKNSSTSEKKIKYLKNFFRFFFIKKAFLRTFIRETIPLNLVPRNQTTFYNSHKAVLAYHTMICMPISIVAKPEQEQHHFGGAKTGAVAVCWFSPLPNIDNPPILNIKF
jgi:hypothetical protein